MANLTEKTEYTPNIYLLELNTPVVGGTPSYSSTGIPTSGFSNVALQQLANRTNWLKSAQQQTDDNLNALDSQVEEVTNNFNLHVGSGGGSHALVTSTTAGFMSAVDKVKLDGIEPQETNLGIANRTNTTLDITSSTGDSTTIPSVTTTEAGLMASADKVKLNGIAAGAEVNQNTFSTVSVSGQADIVADTKTDTLTIVAGSGINITTNAATDSLTISSSGTSGLSLAQVHAAIVSFS